MARWHLFAVQIPQRGFVKMGNSTEVVTVKYEYVDGVHFFYSEEKKALGLIVAQRNLKNAFEEVAKVLKILFRENHGQDLEFVPEVKYLEFRKRIKSLWPEIEKTPAPKIIPAAGMHWKLAA